MKVTAAVVREKKGDFQLEELQLSEPNEDQILVRLAATGLCHTDLICRDQDYPVPLPMVFGHEGAGVVERVGKTVKKVAPGDHVVLTFYTCGRCEACISGVPTSCSNSFVPNFMGKSVEGETTLHDADGAEISGSFFGQSSFANYALAYERNTVKVDPEVPLELLGPLGCGIQTGAGAVLNALNPAAGSTIAIFGAGAVGLSAVMAAVVAGCTNIIAIDVKANRLELATELGATHVLNANEVDPVMALAELVPGGAPFVLETSGIPAVLSQAIRCSSVGGEIGIVGAPPMGATVPVDINFMLFNRKLRGIVEGEAISDIFIPRLIALYKLGRFPFNKLIRMYDFDQINQAAHDSEVGVTLKPVLRYKQ